MRSIKLNTILVLILLIGCNLSSLGQFGQPAAEKKEEFKMQKRLYIGGWIGFGISSYSTYFSIAPVVGYRLSPSIDIGARFNYTFNRFLYEPNNTKYSFNHFGAGVFARYYLFFLNNLFIHAEYEAMNIEYIDPYNSTLDELVTERDWVSSFLVGAG